ncbi:MAG: hypothetical protein ACKO3V_10940, partial [Pirellula sp.]
SGRTVLPLIPHRRVSEAVESDRHLKDDKKHRLRIEDYGMSIPTAQRTSGSDVIFFEDGPGGPSYR